MKLNELSPKMKKVARKRKGQGNATGNGTYAGRGGDGQNSRSGGGVRLGFEGGQTSLIQRMPKMKGFRNPNRVETQAVNLDSLEIRFNDGDTVDFNALVEKGLVSKTNTKVKVLASGEISKKLTIKDLLFSKTAKAAIEKAGGTIA